ncbi:ras-related protein Rab-27B isoform X3 [Strigops habroptila]|uniref:ras-related protein Rab-27B isoform X3 n=1 Tax=Strigops habroptila TaxID=2489341 RepID=UPI0011D03076|nr:ras-related protein Rab-27B isoform X3 [Strigops habroptila]
MCLAAAPEREEGVGGELLALYYREERPERSCQGLKVPPKRWKRGFGCGKVGVGGGVMGLLKVLWGYSRCYGAARGVMGLLKVLRGCLRCYAAEVLWGYSRYYGATQGIMGLLKVLWCSSRYYGSTQGIKGFLKVLWCSSRYYGSTQGIKGFLKVLWCSSRYYGATQGIKGFLKVLGVYSRYYGVTQGIMGFLKGATQGIMELLKVFMRFLKVLWCSSRYYRVPQGIMGLLRVLWGYSSYYGREKQRLGSHPPSSCSFHGASPHCSLVTHRSAPSQRLLRAPGHRPGGHQKRFGRAKGGPREAGEGVGGEIRDPLLRDERCYRV